MAACPLCGEPGSRPSWVGPLTYRGWSYSYRECVDCRSLYCDPMPGPEVLAQLYGPDYAEAFSDPGNIDDPKEREQVLREADPLPRGVFLDYGCGQGELLALAAERGWRSAGIEIDPRVARAVSERTGLPVCSDAADLATAGLLPADVIHLGDVIEHLTDLEGQFEAILGMLRPGGVLLAQGPLEAGPTLFTSLLQIRTFRRESPSEHPPYHVLQATVRGQRRFFQRHGLVELAYRLREVDWPAPSRLSRADYLHTRNLVLWTLRRVSRGCSALLPTRLGNRYFYAGRKPGPPG